MSFFESVTQLPEDPILHLPIAFAADPRTQKVNLGVGSYRDSNGLPVVLNCVRKAEAELSSKYLNKEYQPIEGNASYLKATNELIFGSDFLKSYAGGLFSAQTIGGTGALRLGGEFLVQETSKTIFVPSPTWPNHKPIFTRSGLKMHSYRYYDERTHQLDFAGLCGDISNMSPGSTIMLHGSCHNPTGIDPTQEQWQELSRLIKHHRIIPFFDIAYQGFIGTLDEDARAIRYFASQGHEMLVAYSYSKSCALYGERMGALTVLAQHEEAARKIGSQIKQIVRSIYSTPPLHGMQVINEIMHAPALKKEWLEELVQMRDRIKEMRRCLIDGLERGNSQKDWSFLKRQNGFFSFCGLNPEQVHRLLKDYGIYMLSNSRINVAGLNKNNMDYVIEALLAVTQS